MGQAGKTTKRIFDGRYEILGIVGRGSRSVVYHARHALVPSSEVALKVLLQKKETSSLGEKLRKEALAMVSSRHKYVVRLDDFHSVGDLCYLSMEFAPERDLRVYAEKFGGKLGPKQVELFLSQAAEALNFIHKAGIIHRDLKPENILLDKNLNIKPTSKSNKQGKQAITHWELISTNGNTSIVRVMIETGRRHQIRMALKSIGHPIVGDLTHGATINPLARICLHATSLEFLHPKDDEPVRFEAKHPFKLL